MSQFHRCEAMKKLPHAITLVSLGLVSATATLPSSIARTSTTTETQAVTCEKKPGLLAGPFVASPDTARAIFEAVARGLRGEEFLKLYDINLNDEVDHWALFQSPRPADSCTGSTPSDTICTVTSGGGGLTMRIDKCSGAISQVHYLR